MSSLQMASPILMKATFDGVDASSSSQNITVTGLKVGDFIIYVNDTATNQSAITTADTIFQTATDYSGASFYAIIMRW